MELNSVWRQVVAAKYGIMNGWDTTDPRGPHGYSLWKGIMKLLPLFKEGLGYEVGNGRMTKFWEDAWCGESSLKQDFPYLFSMTIDPTSLVASNFSKNRGEVVWSPIFRRALFDWEISRVFQLLARLADKHIDQDLNDWRVWKYNLGDVFSVKSCYGYLPNPRMLLGPWRDVWFSRTPPEGSILHVDWCIG